MITWTRRTFHTDRGTDPDFNARALASARLGQTTDMGPITSGDPAPSAGDLVVDHRPPTAIAPPSASEGFSLYGRSARRVHIRLAPGSTAPS